MKKLTKIFTAVLCTVVFLVGCGEKAPQKAANVLTDGVYTSSAKSHGGDLSVEMTCKDGKITDLKVLNHSDTPEYAIKATEKLPGEIVKAQSLGVDVISGATMTSRAIMGAAAQCVRDAGGNAREYGYVPVGEIAGKQAITIMGLTDGDKSYTGEQVKAFEAVEADTVSVNAAGEKTPTKCKGVLLETILADCGTSQKNYGSIIITATDGYAIEIPADVLQKRDIIISYETNGEPCDLRSVVPDERAMYWVKFIEKIELMNPVEEVPIKKVLMQETLLKPLAVTEYKYKDSADQAVAMADVLTAMGAKTDFVTLTGADGWGKAEKWDLAQAQYLKITGEDAPMFVGPDLPEGMRLKKTLSIKTGENCCVSVEMAKEKLGANSFKVGGAAAEGVKASALLKELGAKEAANYTLTGADGFTKTITAGDMEKCYITLEEDGAKAQFDTQDKSTSVKQLISITLEG
ncbi:MAG: FMN-binding protein [Oscillospiraceae bacterium]